jgi:DNA-binding response OmpR family regulator
MRILVISHRAEDLDGFFKALEQDANTEVALAPTGEAALEMVGISPPDLAVVDTGLADQGPFEMVTKLMKANVMVNTAVISSLSEDDFHELSEGLGVLVQLPPKPAAEQAVDLLEKLKSVVRTVIAAKSKTDSSTLNPSSVLR